MLILRQEDFEAIVNEAIATIPKEFLEKLNNVTLVIEDEPNARQLEALRLRRGQTHLLGLYEGTPQVKRARYSAALPDKITIFKESLEAIAHSREDLHRLVRSTVLHEIAHHFGMDEAAVRKAETKRGSKNQ